MTPALLIALTCVGLNLPAETLGDENRFFPSDARAPRSIFVVTFSKSASADGSDWTRKLRGEQPKLSAPVYQVAVLEEVPALFRSVVISGMRRGVSQNMHDQFWIVTAKSDEWKQCVAASPEDVPHVVVVDSQEQIVWRTHGEVTDSKIRDLVSSLKANVDRGAH